jgi:Mg-chelatase subunit ChlD
MADGKPTEADGPKSWRRTDESRNESVPDYRWQSDERETAPSHIRRSSVKQRLRILGLGCLIAAVCAFFLAELLFSRPRTPMIVIAPANYELPFQPLSWSHEDVEAFRELDRETLNVHAINSGWKTKDQGIRQLDSQLQNIVRKSRQSPAIVLYLRMHSTVDGLGVPCLIPPGASPFNSDSWLPVKDLLERFRAQQVPDSTPKLVILDCSSVLVNWNQGIVYNTFASRLPEVVQSAAIPNLTILNAAGPSEIGATSKELRRGIFGYYLRLGLAGSADSVSEAGNGDRQVSIRELHRYLLRHVDDWSLSNRGFSQRPQLIPSEPADVGLATVFNPRVSKRTQAELKQTAASSVSDIEINQLWKKLELCQSLEPFRFDPLGWTEFEQQLRWIEIAADSGEAYSRSARRLHQELQQRVATVEQSTDVDRQPLSALAKWARFTNTPLMNVSSARMSTLPLAEFFGTIDQTSVDNLNSILTQFKQAPSDVNLREATRALSGDVGLSQLELASLLGLWQRYDVTKLWPDTTFLSSVIELHEIAESASVPTDERSLDWIRPLIETADAHRRKVDDRVFLGGELPQAEMLSARRFYKHASEVAAQVAKAYAIRDQLDHTLPYLAQWLTRPSHQRHASSAPSLEAKALLFDSTRNQLSLELALSQPTVPLLGESVELPFQGLLHNIELQQERLNDLLAAEYERLLQSDEASTAMWTDIQGLLSIPLMPRQNVRLALSPSQQRNMLREKLTGLGRKLMDRFASATSESSRMSRSSERTAPEKSALTTPLADQAHRSESIQMAEYLDELLIKVPENLGLAIVRRDQAHGDDRASLTDAQSSPTNHHIEAIAETQGLLFRQLMKSVRETAQNGVEQQLASIEDGVFQNVLAERVVRASASVDPTRMEYDPVRLRRSSDLERLLLWHSRRVLNDFWGRSSLDGSTFFDSTATNLMRVAASIGTHSARSQSETSGLNVLLKKYRAAAANGLSTVSDNLLVADPSEPVIAKIAVYQNRQAESLFPAGQGAVFVQNSEGERLGEIHSLTIPWDAGTDPNSTATQFDISLNDEQHRPRPVSLKAVTSFRGHDFVGDLTVNSIAGIAVDYSPHVSRETRIAIRGRSLRKLSIVFVLDCSGSMGQELPLEARTRSVSRLEIAKRSLGSMLERLAEDEGHRVGVICFGHRIGWDLKQAGQFLRQTSYGAPVPDQIRPFDDVETILPLGRFNASFEGVVNDRLATIKPWGESPLYLAIIQALKQFDTGEDDSEKCVVVVTDGVNYQFNPPPVSRKSLADVLATWNDHRVPIHVVGLGIAADQAAAAQREFGELASKTSGTYVSAQEARVLVESLAALQRVTSFRVRDMAGEDHLGELGQPLVMKVDPALQNEFQVSLGPAIENVTLRGGELLELVPTRDGQRLEVLPYETGQPRFVSLLRDEKLNSATELVAGLHRPFRRGRNVTFEISIQHLRRQFVPRPKEAWVEITPVVRPGQPPSPTYVFYDARYLPNTSVPVLQWTVTDWPAGANQARIRVWCRPDQSRPTSTLTLREVVDTARNPDVILEGVAGVNARVRVREQTPLQVSVVERHSNDSTGVGTLKVGLKSSVTPSRVRHRFDSANRIATHLFEFHDRETAVLAEGEIEFTTRTSAQAGAWRMADTVIIDVTESGDVHD